MFVRLPLTLSIKLTITLRFAAKGLTARMDRIAVREALKDEILLVHSEGHWDRVRGTGCTSSACPDHQSQRAEPCSPHPADQSVAYLETCSDYFDRLSLYVNTESAICARLSCGGVIEMCRAVAEGQVRNGFAIVRCATRSQLLGRGIS